MTRKPPAPVALPSLYDLGLLICALSDERNRQDEIVLATGGTRGAPDWDRNEQAKRAMDLLFAREEALVDLGLTMVPEAPADAVAALSLVARRLDEACACDLDLEEMRAIARGALQAMRCALPVVAETAGVDLDDLSGSDRKLCAKARAAGAS